MDQVETMKAFVAVATEGSFIGAAQRMGLSSQLVSKYVSHFEDRLGARLLNRTTRKVSLTEAGAQCLQHAEQILENIRSMEGHFGQMQSVATGVLKISAPSSFATLHLAPLLCDFQKAHPGVAINLELNDRKVDVIEEGFDLALRIGHLQSSSLIAKRVVSIRLVLCASQSYIQFHGWPQQPYDLNPNHYLPYSHLNYHQPESELMQFLKTASQSQSTRFCANNGEVLMAAALSGEGYVFQPTFIVGPALQQGTLKRLLPEYEPDPIALYVVYPHRKLLAPKLRVFIDFMATYFTEPPYWDAFG